MTNIKNINFDIDIDSIEHILYTDLMDEFSIYFKKEYPNGYTNIFGLFDSYKNNEILTENQQWIIMLYLIKIKLKRYYYEKI